MRLRTTSAVFGALALSLAATGAEALTTPKALDAVSGNSVVPVYGDYYGYGYRPYYSYDDRRYYGYRYYRPYQRYRPYYRYSYRPYYYRSYRPYYDGYYGYRRSWW